MGWMRRWINIRGLGGMILYVALVWTLPLWWLWLLVDDYRSGRRLTPPAGWSAQERQERREKDACRGALVEIAEVWVAQVHAARTAAAREHVPLPQAVIDTFPPLGDLADACTEGPAGRQRVAAALRAARGRGGP